MRELPRPKSVLGRALARVFDWALSKNSSGGYAGEDDPRWCYTIESDGDPYLTRLLLPRVNLPVIGEVRATLHWFHRPDADRWMHNHPWAWALSVVLLGSYTEERLEAIVPLAMGAKSALSYLRRVRFFNFLTGADYHSIRETHGDTFTLFVQGPNVQDWGFLKQKFGNVWHVPHAEYFEEKRAGVEQ